MSTPTKPTAPELTAVTQCTKDFAAARLTLRERMERRQKAIIKIERLTLPGIKSATMAVMAARTRLLSALTAAKAQFTPKKRTIVLEGIKVGFREVEGELVYAGKQDDVIARIKKLLPAQYADLVEEKPTLKKDALRALPAGDLAKIGCHIQGAGDQPVISAHKDELEKLIEKILDNALAEKINAEGVL